MPDQDLAIVEGDEEVEKRVHEVYAKINELLNGRPREECARIMGAVAMTNGFYDQAIAFAEAAKKFRDAVYRSSDTQSH